MFFSLNSHTASAPGISRAFLVCPGFYYYSDVFSSIILFICWAGHSLALVVHVLLCNEAASPYLFCKWGCFHSGFEYYETSLNSSQVLPYLPWTSWFSMHFWVTWASSRSCLLLFSDPVMMMLLPSSGAVVSKGVTSYPSISSYFSNSVLIFDFLWYSVNEGPFWWMNDDPHLLWLLN